MVSNIEKHSLDPEMEKELAPPLADAIKHGAVPELSLIHI